MRVKATGPCFVKYYREPGDEFEIEPEQFNAACMAKVEEYASEAQVKKRSKKEDGAASSTMDSDVI